MRVLLLLSFLFASIKVFGIGDDSTYHHFDPNWTKYRTWSQADYRTIDTSIHLLQRYNPAMREYYMRSTGNLGYPAYRLIPYFFDDIGFKTGLNAFDIYMYKADDVKFFNTRKPYTELQYLMGSGNEQWFKGNHTQNIGKQYNFGFAFSRIGSDGIYQNMRTDYTNLLAHQSFQTRNERYEIDFCAYRNKVLIHFNGGVNYARDSVFNNPAFITKMVVPVKLDSALTSVINRNLSIQQYFNFGSLQTKKINDTLTIKKRITTSRVIHRVEFNENNYLFSDTRRDFAYYPHVFYNANNTHDSLFVTSLKNEIHYQLTEVKKQLDTAVLYRTYIADFFIKHSLYRFANNTINQVQNLNLGFEVKKQMLNVPGQFLKNIWNNSFAFLKGEYSFIDYNKGEYFITANIAHRLLGGILYLRYDDKRTMPTLMEQHYHGNHYEWQNDFNPSTFRRAGISFSVWNGQIVLYHSYVFIKNPIFFNTQALPSQVSGMIYSTQSSLKLNLSFSNFHLDNQFGWQRYSSALYQVPSFFSVHSVYYANHLFKSALLLEAGVDVFNNGNFTPYNFNINTSQYYAQSTIPYSKYLWADAFINMKIKSVRIIIKSDNVLQGLLSDGTYLIPGWPLPDRSIKLIINWMFWN